MSPEAYAERKAAQLAWRQALLEHHYGPKSPCMFIIGVMPTNPALTESTDSLVKTLYVPDSIRRMVLAVVYYVLRMHRKVRIHDGTLKRGERL